MALYKVSYTARVVSCKQCKVKLARGDLRVDRGKQGAYHPACLFNSFLCKKQGEDVQGPGDLLGWDDLLDADKVSLQDNINQYLLNKNAMTNAGNGSSTTLNPNTNTTPCNTSNKTPYTPGSSSSSSITCTTSSSPSTSGITSTTSPSSSSIHSISTNPSNINAGTSLPSQGVKRKNIAPPPLVISDSESDPPTPPPKTTRVSPPQPKPHPSLPNLLEGVNIPPGPPRTYDECAVCLDQPVHPVTLPCSHIFCYLCAKGLTRQAGNLATCSLCRNSIPEGYLESAHVLAKASLDLDDSLPLEAGEAQGWQWFYEGRNGWWKFEERNNEELEENYSLGQKIFETMICGNLYIIDFQTMEQCQKGFPNRKRKIKRDLKTSSCKGVAGLQKRKWVL